MYNRDREGSPLWLTSLRAPHRTHTRGDRGVVRVSACTLISFLTLYISFKLHHFLLTFLKASFTR